MQNSHDDKYEKQSKKIALLNKVVNCFVIFTVGVVGGIYFQQHRAAGSLGVDNYNALLSGAEIVKEKSINEYTADEITDMMLGGLAAYIEDDYSYYFNPEEKAAYDDSREGIIRGGIGVQIVTQQDGKVLITDVYDDSPAQKAGIKAGDYIIGVDGKEVKDIENLTEAVGGEEGSIVRVTVSRNQQLLAFDVTRGEVKQTMVRYRAIDNIMYINLKSFNGNAVEKFQEALDAARSNKSKGIILDLRDNGGGDLSILQQIGDKILPKGVIIYAQDRKGNKINEISSSGNGINLPMVILTNGNTASASEALAGAARDYGTAVLVGTKTFGKGIMQTTYTLNNEGAFKLTVAKYYLPKGECIHGVGLIPKYEIKLPNDSESRPYDMTDEEDTQLQKALEILK